MDNHCGKLPNAVHEQKLVAERHVQYRTMDGKFSILQQYHLQSIDNPVKTKWKKVSTLHRELQSTE